MNKWCLFAMATVFLSGCYSGNSQADVDQSKLCIATTDQQAMQCEDGQLFMARLSQPDSNVRAYNVLNTAALYCNTNYPVFENPAGLICVMTHDRISKLAGLQEEKESATENSGSSSE